MTYCSCRLKAFSPLCAVAAALLLAQGALVGQSPERAAAEPPLPNVGDVAAQIEFYAERLGQSLDDDGDYNETDQTRVEKDAATAAALALLLSKHRDDHRLKPAAAAMLSAASEITTRYREHEPAAAALKRLQAALASPAKPDTTAAVDAAAGDDALPAAGTAMLMKQMRFVENRLKLAARRRTPSEISRGELAAHSATFAALAAPVARDAKQFAKTAEQQRLWEQQSADMAAAAARLNVLAKDADAAGIAEAVRALDATCTRCHADFDGPR